MHQKTLLTLFLITVLVSLGLAAGPDPSPRQETSHFPAPDGPLVIPEAESLSLVDVLKEFRRVTGQNIVINSSTHQAMEATPLGLLGGVTVPATEVYSFMEGLLSRHNFLVSELRDGEPRLLAVHHPDHREGSVYRWTEVDVDRVADYEDHHALLIQTVVTTAPLDARQAVSALRSLVDHNRVRLVAMSKTNLLIQGTGREVADWVSVLQRASANEESFLEAYPPQEPR